MTDWGIVLFVIAALLACVGPAEKAFAAWRVDVDEVDFAVSFAPDPELEALVAEADAALEQDDLARGVAATARTYDRAARRR